MFTSFVFSCIIIKIVSALQQTFASLSFVEFSNISIVWVCHLLLVTCILEIVTILCRNGSFCREDVLVLLYTENGGFYDHDYE